MTAFLIVLALFILGLALIGAIADALGEPERWDSRRRNGR